MADISITISETSAGIIASGIVGGIGMAIRQIIAYLNARDAAWAERTKQQSDVTATVIQLAKEGAVANIAGAKAVEQGTRAMEDLVREIRESGKK